MDEKKISIENFIGVYDNFITDQECKTAIELFEDQSKINNVMSRLQSENASSIEKKDLHFFAQEGNIEVWWDKLKTMMFNFDVAFQNYLTQTGAKEGYGVDQFYYTALKIQKTKPTEGYHIWHLEHNRGRDNEGRAFVFSIYLNDVEDGGETEFLHFSKRVKPKTGRIVIWPAGFPYVHRGNPPLSGEKYILTSWMMLS